MEEDQEDALRRKNMTSEEKLKIRLEEYRELLVAKNTEVGDCCLSLTVITPNGLLLPFSLMARSYLLHHAPCHSLSLSPSLTPTIPPFSPPSLLPPPPLATVAYR